MMLYLVLLFFSGRYIETTEKFLRQVQDRERVGDTDSLKSTCLVFSQLDKAEAYACKTSLEANERVLIIPVDTEECKFIVPHIETSKVKM